MSERKPVKTYKTATGAQQYGSQEDFLKHANLAFQRFLDNPTIKNLQIVERLEAGFDAATAKKFKDKYGKNSSSFIKFKNKMEKNSLTQAQKTRARSLLKVSE